LARAIDADFLPVDFVLPWQLRPRSGPGRRYASWLACALLFPRRRDYDLFLTEGPQFPPLLMKRLGLVRGPQRVAALMDNETLYFLRERRYPATTRAALLLALESYDALLCVGKMQAAMAGELLAARGRKPRLVVTPSGVSVDRLRDLSQVAPPLSSEAVVFVGNGPGAWRGWYKGLDLAMNTLALASTRRPALQLLVAGEWDRDYFEAVRARCATPERITPLGGLARIASAFERAALCLHLGRGEAFGISVLESLCAGVPCIVSEWTGAKEVVEQVDPRLVVPLDAAEAARRVLWYFDLPPEEKRRLSGRGRDVAGQSTEPRAAEAFRLNVRELFE
jgi:glycosyltransferase involved in cell wall biosynthesis